MFSLKDKKVMLSNSIQKLQPNVLMNTVNFPAKLVFFLIFRFDFKMFIKLELQAQFLSAASLIFKSFQYKKRFILKLHKLSANVI